MKFSLKATGYRDHKSTGTLFLPVSHKGYNPAVKAQLYLSRVREKEPKASHSEDSTHAAMSHDVLQCCTSAPGNSLTSALHECYKTVFL